MRAIQKTSVVMAMVLTGISCSSIDLTDVDQSIAPVLNPSQRVVRVETTGCGFAADRTGSGVAVGDGLVLTVAHLVARADDIAASVGSGESMDAVVTAIDLKMALALLRVPPNGIPVVEMSSVGAGAKGNIVGGASSGTVPFEVTEVVKLTIEEILGSDSHSRLGYELEAETSPGDSGAGAYDTEKRLIGVVFATGQDGESSWITSSAEIEGFLAKHDSDTAPIGCDSEASRLDVP